jgi:hypothetical protein
VLGTNQQFLQRQLPVIGSIAGRELSALEVSRGIREPYLRCVSVSCGLGRVINSVATPDAGKSAQKMYTFQLVPQFPKVGILF